VSGPVSLIQRICRPKVRYITTEVVSGASRGGKGQKLPGLQDARYLDEGVQKSNTDGWTFWEWVARLDRLDLEVEGDEGEDQALHASRHSINGASMWWYE
jgi:hypothetical protein